MAARRAMCPRCGAPVGIPSLQPTHRGTVAAPLTPLERQRLARERPLPPTPAPAPQPAAAAPAAPRPVAVGLVRLLSDKAKRRADLTGRDLEKHWHECLLYPLRAWRLCLWLSVFLTALSVAGALVVPGVLAEAPADPLALAVLRLACVLLLVLVVGVPCSFLDCVLASAAAGEVYYIRWSGDPLRAVLLSGARWLTCFLAGPSVFAVVGWLYWLHCGEPGWLDWLILIELGVVGIACWIFALLTAASRGWLRALNPAAVVDLAHGLGWRALVVVLSAALVLLAHGWVLLAGAAEVHGETANGWLLLTGGWVSGVFWSTFFCRLLGVWCHRARPRGGAPAAAEDDSGMSDN
jgi:hypothetical protein